MIYMNDTICIYTLSPIQYIYLLSYYLICFFVTDYTLYIHYNLLYMIYTTHIYISYVLSDYTFLSSQAAAPWISTSPLRTFSRMASLCLKRKSMVW